MEITIDIAHGSARLSCHELKSKLAIYLFFELATTKSWRRPGSVFGSVAQGLNLELPKNTVVRAGIDRTHTSSTVQIQRANHSATLHAIQAVKSVGEQ